jgi:hypothetical protein
VPACQSCLSALPFTTQPTAMTTPDHDPFPELLLARQDDDALGMSMLIYPDRTPARNLFWLTLAVFVLLYALPWRETYFQACVLTSAIYTLPTVWSWGWQNYAHLDIQTIHLSADNGISSHRIAPIADNGANHLRILPRHTETRYVRSNLDSGVFLTNILLLLVVFAAGYNDISRILRDKTPEIPLAQMWVVEGKTPAEPWVISTRQSTRSYLLIDGVYLNCDFYFEHDACDEVYRFAGKPIKVWYYRNNRRVDAVYAIEIDGQSLHDEHYFRARYRQFQHTMWLTCFVSVPLSILLFLWLWRRAQRVCEGLFASRRIRIR